MAKFKIIISDPETGKSKSLEIEGSRAVPLVGRKIGDEVDGSIVEMTGHKLRITGGSDKDGFPIRPDVHGGVRVSVIVNKGVGFRSARKGKRQRKTLRGNIITEDIVQLNMKIVEKPKKAEKPPTKKKAAKKVAKEAGEEGGEKTEEKEGKG